MRLTIKDALNAMKLNQEIKLSPTQIIPKENRAELPLSFIQQRLWLLNQLEPSSPSYHKSISLHFVGAFNLGILRQSLDEIIRRHEVLRLNIITVDGQPVPAIVSVPLELPIVELPLPKKQRDAVQRLIGEEAQKPIDWNQGLLLRAMLLRLHETENVLLLTVHNLVFDDESIKVFLQELALLYEAFSTGKPSPLNDLPIQYSDFAYAQRHSLQGEALNAQLAYWKQQLSSIPPSLQLPIDRPRSTLRIEGARQSFTIPQTLTEKLEALNSQQNVTMFMTLLAAFKVLLYRYTGQEDIVVGSPIAGREWVETEDLIGPFVNTLAIRTNFSGNDSFKELLNRVQDVTLAAHAHRHLPFEQLVAALQPEQDLNRHPLFQVLFAFKDSLPTLELSDLTLNCLQVDSQTNLDLSLSIQYGQELIGTLDYNKELFDDTTITRMLGNLQTLLESVVDNPEQHIKDLPLLTETEHQLLVEWNDTRVDYPLDACLHELFEKQVESQPDAVAIAFEDEQLTYRELNQQANKVAHHLQSLGVGPEVPVGLYLGRSLELAVGILGILKAGGACVPLDPADPESLLDFMLEDTQLPVLLTQNRLREEKEFLNKPQLQVVCVDAIQDSALENAQNPLSQVTPNNLAYIAYTSGSTGRPKGVMVSHLALCSRQVWFQNACNLDRSDRFLMSVARGLVIHYALLSPLILGGLVIVANPTGHQDITYLVRLIAQQRITVIYSVPSMLRVFLKEGLDACNCLQHVFCGGEALSGEIQEQFFQHFAAQLHNPYGATEAAQSTLWHCQPGSYRKIVPIGRPADNTQIHILDSRLQPVPIGVPGEIYIGGNHLARGYLNRPDLTAERFISDPFGESQFNRLYKTGDLGRYLPDGTIEYLGRIDRQIKIRGFRIEPGEIETVLRSHPDVQQAVAIDREDIPGDKRLVAYIVPKRDRTPTLNELRSFLANKLPSYMLPSSFMLLDTLPIMAGGKLDRKALAAPSLVRPELEKIFVAPRNPIEQLLAAIWTEILGVEQVGMYDNFFELGGHSLLATQIVSRVQKIFLVTLPLQKFFEAPTVAEMSQTIVLNEVKPGQTEKIARVVQKIRNMTQEALRETLQEKKRENNGHF